MLKAFLIAVFGVLFVAPLAKEAAEVVGPEEVAATTTVAPSTTTSTTSTTVPPTTTTTQPDLSGVDWEALRQMEIDALRAQYGACGEWHDLALSVGWPAEEWQTLSAIIRRESNCQPDAWNGADAGLLQINQIHKTWLADMGWSHPDDMFDPTNNLTFGFRLWQASGWQPWSFSGTVPPSQKNKSCPEWEQLALAVGWPAAELPRLSYVMWRESRCNPESFNPKDPNGGSRGLIQINGFWCRPNKYDPNGFLVTLGIVNVCEDLFDPATNLRAGLAMWQYGENEHGNGWRPWAV